MMLVLGLLDFFVAGISLVFGLFLFGFIASLLCAVAFFNNAKDVSSSWLTACKISFFSSFQISIFDGTEMIMKFKDV